MGLCGDEITGVGLSVEKEGSIISLGALSQDKGCIPYQGP